MFKKRAIKIFLLGAVFLAVFLFSGCKKNEMWQGTYFKNGKQENMTYGPVFTNYAGCKEWALGKIVNKDDKVECSKNCHDSIKDVPVCEMVVRNYELFAGSQTFDNYEE